VTFSLVGYFAGNSYAKVASTIGKGSAVVVALLVITGLALWHVRRKRNDRVEEKQMMTAPTHREDARVPS
jgi:membrane protein DedA with SNARE-associated domain